MSNSTTKKVYVRRFDRETLEGYVSPHSFLRPDGIELMNREAEVVLIPYNSARAVYFVREFKGNPEGDQRNVFASRPKRGGLWVEMKFRDDELLEGVLPNDLRQVGEHGVTITPPDANANTQKVFVPREAMSEFRVLGVIGSPIRGRRARPKATDQDQLDLFNAQVEAVS